MSHNIFKVVSCPVCDAPTGANCTGRGIFNNGTHHARKNRVEKINSNKRIKAKVILMSDKANTPSEKRKLSYKLDFTIGEKRALVDFIKNTRVVDVPENVDIVNLKKALVKLRA